jgi:hypothetical protein
LKVHSNLGLFTKSWMIFFCKCKILNEIQTKLNLDLRWGQPEPASTMAHSHLR